MYLSGTTRFFASLTFTCLLLTGSSVRVDAKGGSLDRKFGRLPTPPSFHLFGKLRGAVTSGSLNGGDSAGADSEDLDEAPGTQPEDGPLPQPAMEDVLVPPMMEEIPTPPVEIEAKATGVRITPTRTIPTEPEVEPKATGVRVTPTRTTPVEPEVEPKATGVRMMPAQPIPAEAKPELPVEPSASHKCSDVPPDSVYTCAEQKAFGKCEAEFMVKDNFCAKTCGRAPCPLPSEETGCTDVPPGSDYTCAQQREFGKCNAEFMVMGNYCARTCGRAPCPEIDTGCNTISRGVEGSPLLAFLDLALEVTTLKDVFDDPSLRVTIFAPTNVAFEDLLNDLEISAEELLEFPDVIEEILGAHVLTQPLLARELEDGAVFETMSEMSDLEVATDGREVFVFPDFGIPAEVVSPDLDACGSVVHVIDAVLIPDREILNALNLPDRVKINYEEMAMTARGLQ